MNIRKYQTGDENKIYELDQRELYSKWNTRDMDNWYWKFSAQNPLGNAYIWLIERDGRLVAHFAAIKNKFKIFEKEKICANAIGSLVDKKFQKRGLMKLVGDKLFDELDRDSIPLTYGLPNDRAHLFQQIVFNFKDLIKINVWSLKKAKLKNIKTEKNVIQINEFGNEFDELWERTNKDYKITIVRDSNYLNWRYIKRPDWNYFCFALTHNEILNGYIVLKLYQEEDILKGHILDIYSKFNNQDGFNKLINYSLLFFKEKNVDVISLWIFGNPIIETVLADNKFESEQIEKNLTIRVNKNLEHSKELLDQKNWYFAMGDSIEIF